MAQSAHITWSNSRHQSCALKRTSLDAKDTMPAKPRSETEASRPTPLQHGV